MGIRKKCFREVSQTELFTYDGECYMRLSKVYEDIDKLYKSLNWGIVLFYVRRQSGQSARVLHQGEREEE